MCIIQDQGANHVPYGQLLKSVKVPLRRKLSKLQFLTSGFFTLLNMRVRLNKMVKVAIIKIMVFTSSDSETSSGFGQSDEVSLRRKHFKAQKFPSDDFTLII